MPHWALPRNKTVYLLFDKSNGWLSRRYVWWFDTYADAMKHRREQLAAWNAARLSMPVKAALKNGVRG